LAAWERCTGLAIRSKELKLTKNGTDGASQLNSSARPQEQELLGRQSHTEENSLMPSKTSKPSTVGQFIRSAPKEAQPKLREIRSIILKAAPRAKESLKWGMPAVSYKRILVMYAGYRQHIGFYPTPSPIRAFKKELAGFKTAKGSIQFPLDRPLPVSLIRKITAFRVRESLEEDAKWKS
jgi:uncharacterized protein YdhG (YjbR/CyaY superfamily)